MSDIEFNRYGDISFFSNDIDMINDNFDEVYQHVINRLITNYGDYKMHRDFGANLSKYFGNDVNEETERKIKNSIFNTLTFDGLIEKTRLEILTLKQKDRIFVRIIIGSSNINVVENIVVNSIFNTSSGLLYVTN